MWEPNGKSRLQVARVWLQPLSSSPSSPGALSIPHATSNSPKAVAMTSIPMNQSLEDQFLHWRQDMERKQEEQARQMKELQDQADPYDHMLHYNQAMTLNAGNDWLLCKIFLAILRGLALAWFHKLPCFSINSFNNL